MSASLSDSNFGMVPLHLFEFSGRFDLTRTILHVPRVRGVYYGIGDKIDLAFHRSLGLEPPTEGVRATIVEASEVRLLDVVDADLPLVGRTAEAGMGGRSGREAYLWWWDLFVSSASLSYSLRSEAKFLAGDQNPMVWRIRWVYDAAPVERMVML